MTMTTAELRKWALEVLQTAHDKCWEIANTYPEKASLADVCYGPAAEADRLLYDMANTYPEDSPESNRLHAAAGAMMWIELANDRHDLQNYLADAEDALRGLGEPFDLESWSDFRDQFWNARQD